MTATIGKVIGRMGLVAGLVIHSEGWDEITLHGKTQVAEMMNGQVKTYTLTAKDFGLPRVAPKELAGGDAQYNAKIITDIFENKPHPAKHVIIANAAALIWVTERGFFKRKKFLLKFLQNI
jgi:anthranilate phosphoribosyltransferase